MESSSQKAIKFPNEPRIRWETDDIKSLVLWGTKQGMSDMLLRSAAPVWMRLHGKWLCVTGKEITANELFIILDTISNNLSASTGLKSSGSDFDFAYEIEKSRGVRLRYRCNAAAVADGYSKGIRIVLRTIPSVPPSLKDLDVEPKLLEHAFPDNGLVLVTGVMGSGKSTFIFSCLRDIIEKGGRNVLTYEEPIEFNLDAIEQKGGPISQSQVPDHLSTFLAGIRNCTRVAPDVVLIGESRDPETLRGMIESAEIGVAAYSTVHTRSVPETLSRIINVFPLQERSQVKSTLISSLRLIVQQRLLPAINGGRVAIREFLPFTSHIREQLLPVAPEDLIRVSEDLLYKYGQPLQVATERLFEEGKIHKVDYLAIKAERANREEAHEH